MVAPREPLNIYDQNVQESTHEHGVGQSTLVISTKARWPLSCEHTEWFHGSITSYFGRITCVGTLRSCSGHRECILAHLDHVVERPGNVLVPVDGEQRGLEVVHEVHAMPRQLRLRRRAPPRHQRRHHPRAVRHLARRQARHARCVLEQTHFIYFYYQK